MSVCPWLASTDQLFCGWLSCPLIPIGSSVAHVLFSVAIILLLLFTLVTNFTPSFCGPLWNFCLPSQSSPDPWVVCLSLSLPENWSFSAVSSGSSCPFWVSSSYYIPKGGLASSVHSSLFPWTEDKLHSLTLKHHHHEKFPLVTTPNSHDSKQKLDTLMPLSLGWTRSHIISKPISLHMFSGVNFFF